MQLVGSKLLLLIGFVQTLILTPKILIILGAETYGFWITIAGLVGLLAILDLGATGLASQRGAHFVGRKDIDGFITAAKTRQWDREKSVRTLA